MAVLRGFAKNVFFLLLRLSRQCEALSIPEPNGSYAVALNTTTLLDGNRIDPFDPAHGQRNVTISLFYPVDRNECTRTCAVPYMPPATASYFDTLAATLTGSPPPSKFETFNLQVCCDHSLKAEQNATQFPLALFSAGLGGSRLMYSIMAQKLASSGYAVATLDSTYNSAIVEYPDGTYVTGRPTEAWCDERDPAGVCNPSADMLTLLETGVQDARFVMDTLSHEEGVKDLIPGATCGFDVDRVAFLGHSFGGATAVRAAMEDNHVVGAGNMDGSVWGNLTDTRAATLLFGRSDPSPHNMTNDATWQDTWDHLKGWRRQIGLKDMQHNGFDDFPFLTKIAGWPTEPLQGFFGKIDGERSFDVVTTYLKEFLDVTLKNKASELFEGPSKAFPEVVVDERTR